MPLPVALPLIFGLAGCAAAVTTVWVNVDNLMRKKQVQRDAAARVIQQAWRRRKVKRVKFLGLNFETEQFSM